jgi:hypothetical protein
MKRKERAKDDSSTLHTPSYSKRPIKRASSRATASSRAHVYNEQANITASKVHYFVSESHTALENGNEILHNAVVFSLNVHERTFRDDGGREFRPTPSMIPAIKNVP